MANAMGTAVLGLYACTDGTRSGPYSDLRWTINRYPQAAAAFLNRPVDQVAWGRRIEFPGVMDLVTVDDAIGRFEAFRAARTGAPQAPAR
jgi:heptosyltransferase I